MQTYQGPLLVKGGCLNDIMYYKRMYKKKHILITPLGDRTILLCGEELCDSCHNIRQKHFAFPNSTRFYCIAFKNVTAIFYLSSALLFVFLCVGRPQCREDKCYLWDQNATDVALAKVNIPNNLCPTMVFPEETYPSNKTY